ncbi:MAG: DNA alkylation repair protein [Thermoleophilia bacterium]
MTTVEEIQARLEALGSPEAREGMARFGITARCAYGVRLPQLRSLAAELGVNHSLALSLWAINCRETRILAGMIADPELVAPELMDLWARDFDSWEICDQTCMNLFDRTRYNYQKAVEWSTHPDQFVKRAGFVLMAQRAVRDREAPDRVFTALFPLIEKGSGDDRPYVKKAVSWALRQIGKRNPTLNREAVELARRLKASPRSPSRWVGSDAFRELTGQPVRRRLGM